MNINFNMNGRSRKALAQAIAELTYSEMSYAGAPTFAYRIGDYTVDKNGAVYCPDTAAPEALALLIEKLKEQGFTPEQTEDEAPAPVAAETPDVAPESEAEAQPEDELTEPDAGEEPPDMGEDPVEEAIPAEDAPAEAETEEAPAEEIVSDDETEAEGESAAPSDEDDDTHLTISIPRDALPDDALYRLKQIVANKQLLFKNALRAEALPIIVTDEEISFPWFTPTGMDGEAAAYAQFITALCQMAREQKRILDKPYNGDNDRFAMRIFMVRLGMKGAEYALARKLMMRRLSGNSGWRYGAPAETVPIYWNDLTPEKQQELLEALGDNGNYDVHPLTEIPVPRKEGENESV